MSTRCASCNKKTGIMQSTVIQKITRVDMILKRMSVIS